jgi:hypothetical protein
LTFFKASCSVYQKSKVLRGIGNIYISRNRAHLVITQRFDELRFDHLDLVLETDEDVDDATNVSAEEDELVEMLLNFFLRVWMDLYKA